MEHLASGAERAPKRPDGRGKHLWHALRRAGRRQRESRLPSIFGQASNVLLPWPLIEYPGRGAGMVQVLEGRASTHAIEHWRLGRRRAPQWAVTLLAGAIERRITDLQHALEILQKEKTRD